MNQPSISHRLALSGALTAAALVSHLATVPAAASLYLILDPLSGPPATEVTGRTGGEGAFSTQVDPLQAYLVAAATADAVTSPDDPHLVRIGELVVDAAGNGRISFRVPHIEPGDYVVVAFCPSCSPSSAGRTMVPLADFQVTPSPPATDTVPVAPDEWSSLGLAGGALLLAGVLLAALRRRALR